jgi:DNA-directed RNA polymerase sigma subunit (sigma70/sigma32)
MSRASGWRPRGAQDSEVQFAYSVEVICPQMKDIHITRFGINPSLWFEVNNKRKYHTLREIANEYGVSYETVRRIIKKYHDLDTVYH